MKHIIVLNQMKKEALEEIKKLTSYKFSVITDKKSFDFHQNLNLPNSSKVYYVDNLSNYNQLLDLAIELNKQSSLTHIIPTDETLMIQSGFLNSYFDLKGNKLDTVLGFTNKLIMKKRLKEKGIAVANFVEANDINELDALSTKIGYPIVLKPAIGAGSMNTYKINSKLDYLEKLQSGILDHMPLLDTPLMIEEFIQMKNEYHCDAILHNGEVVFSSVGRYFEPSLELKNKNVSGSVNIGTSDENYSGITSLCNQVTKVLGITSGVVHMEVFSTDEGYILGEIGCRPAGGLITGVVERQFGVNLWEYYFSLLLDLEVKKVQIIQSSELFGWIGLTCKAGRIIELTTNEDLYQINQIKEIIDLYNVGDTVDNKWEGSTIFFSKVFYFGIKKREDLSRLLREVDDKYKIKTTVLEKKVKEGV